MSLAFFALMESTLLWLGKWYFTKRYDNYNNYCLLSKIHNVNSILTMIVNIKEQLNSMLDNRRYCSSSTAAAGDLNCYAALPHWASCTVMLRCRTERVALLCCAAAPSELHCYAALPHRTSCTAMLRCRTERAALLCCAAALSELHCYAALPHWASYTVMRFPLQLIVSYRFDWPSTFMYAS